MLMFKFSKENYIKFHKVVIKHTLPFTEEKKITVLHKKR